MTDHGDQEKEDLLVMKRMMLVAVCVFALSLVAPGLDTFFGSKCSSTASAEIRSETKREQDEAYRRGRERAQGYKQGRGGRPSDDGYRDMDDTQREAYKRGYRDGQ